VLGAEHPDTLATANNLAMSLKKQGKYAEAEGILLATLASCQRVLGPAHPNLNTQTASAQLEGRARSHPRHTADHLSRPGRRHRRGASAARRHSRARAKPEHNGKRARVLSFDLRTGRFAVALDDGKELSLKAECKCVARAGCAAAGATLGMTDGSPPRV
jgi:hypothetical protein